MSTTVMTHTNSHTRVAVKLVQSDNAGDYVTMNIGDDVKIFIDCPHKLQDLINAAQKAADEWTEAQLKTLDELS